MRKLDYWFGEITTLGALSDHDLVGRLKALGEKELAESIEIALLEAELAGPVHRFSAQGRKIRDRLPWAHTFHVMGYVPASNTSKSLVEILPVEALEADQELIGRRITLTLGGFQPHRYPGGEEEAGGSVYRVLFHFSAGHFPGEEEFLHFNTSHRVREQEPFRFLDQTVFSGLTVDAPGLDLSYMTLPLHDPCDTSFFEVLSSAMARRGLELLEKPQPAAAFFSAQALQTTNKVLREMDPVSEVYVGLGFQANGRAAPLRLGTYIVAQVAPEDEMLFDEDGWGDWLFSLRTGQIVDRQSLRELFPFNYVLLTIDPFSPHSARRFGRALDREGTPPSQNTYVASSSRKGGDQAPASVAPFARIPSMAGPAVSPSQPRRSHDRREEAEIGRKADLTIRVGIEKSGGNSRLIYELDSGIPELRFPPVSLPGPVFEISPEDYRDQILSMISDLGKGLFKEEPIFKEGIRGRLVNLGRSLYRELFPEEMRQAYRYFRDKIRSLRIITSEPWFPWELIRPYDSDGGKVIDDDFLCLRYELTRWHPGDLEPVHELRIHQMAAIHAGRVSGLETLQKADDEYAMLMNMAIEYPEILDRSLADKRASRDEVVRLLEEGGLDLLHIIGHGDFDTEYSDNAGIYLQDRRRLLSSDIIGPVATEIARSRPMVFLSSCLAGRQGFSLTGLGGWASAFVKAGCGAFLGPQWAISDSSAYKLSRKFYHALEEGRNLGSAAQIARTSLAEEDSSAALLGALSFVVYAHPNGRVFFPGTSFSESDQES